MTDERLVLFAKDHEPEAPWGIEVRVHPVHALHPAERVPRQDLLPALALEHTELPRRERRKVLHRRGVSRRRAMPCAVNGLTVTRWPLR